MVCIFRHQCVFQTSAFLTEIHHINGQGEDGGVMYSEMKGVENNAHWRTTSQLCKTMYPNSGYSFVFGGALHNIRTRTSIDKIRAYHEKFYRPENLTLIIIGKIGAEKVFAALKPMLEEIKTKPKREEFTRPWQTPVEGISESHDIKVSKTNKCFFIIRNIFQ